MDGTMRHTTLDGLALKPYLGSATMGDYAVDPPEWAGADRR